ERPHEEAGPERQHDEEEERVLPLAAARDHVRRRVAEQETDDRARRAVDDRAPEDREVEPIAETQVVLEREPSLDAAVEPLRHEAVREHDPDRHEEEDDEPESARREQEPRRGLRTLVE